jgi:peptidoglycan-N-acetylglucosamine deacetylase
MSKKLHITILVLLLLSASSALARTSSPSTTTPKKGYYVNKNFEVVPFDQKANKKVVLITIDDGPSKYSTSMVSTLLAHKAPAIFFVNGIHDKTNLGHIKRIHDAGFAIGNHTWSHANLNKISKDNVSKEIESNTKLIKKITGGNPAFFRPPYGVSNKYVRELVKKDGMVFMNWSGSAKDWEKNTRDKKVFFDNVMKDLHPGEILLIHEHEWTSKYLDELLTELEKKGYTFIDPKDIKGV